MKGSPASTARARQAFGPRTLRGVVLRDSMDAPLAEPRTAAVRMLVRKYHVVVAGPAP